MAVTSVEVESKSQLLLVCDYLEKVGLVETVRALEAEADIQSTSPGLAAVRSLALDGKWRELEKALLSMHLEKEGEEPQLLRRAKYSIAKQQYLEAVAGLDAISCCREPSAGELGQVQRSLERLEKLAPSKEEYDTLEALLDSHTDFFNSWNLQKARKETCNVLLEWSRRMCFGGEEKCPTEKREDSGRRVHSLTLLLAKGKMYEECEQVLHEKCCNGGSMTSAEESAANTLLDISSWLQRQPNGFFQEVPSRIQVVSTSRPNSSTSMPRTGTPKATPAEAVGNIPTLTPAETSPGQSCGASQLKSTRLVGEARLTMRKEDGETEAVKVIVTDSAVEKSPGIEGETPPTVCSSPAGHRSMRERVTEHKDQVEMATNRVREGLKETTDTLPQHPVTSHMSPQDLITSHMSSQHPVTTHTSPQHPVTTHTSPQHPVTTHTSPQCPVPTHTSPQHPVTTHTSPQRPVTTHTSPQHPVTTHTSPQHPVTTHTSPQHPVTTHTSPQHPVTTHTSPQHPVTTHTSPQRPVTTHQHPVTTHTSPQHAITTDMPPQCPINLALPPPPSTNGPDPQPLRFNDGISTQHPSWLLQTTPLVHSLQKEGRNSSTPKPSTHHLPCSPATSPVPHIPAAGSHATPIGRGYGSSERKQINFDQDATDGHRTLEAAPLLSVSWPTATLTGKVTDTQAVRSVAFSRSGQLVAVGANSKCLRLYSTAPILDGGRGEEMVALQEYPRYHRGSIYCLAWLGDDLLVSGSNDKTIKFLSCHSTSGALSCNPRGQMNFHEGTVRELAFLSNGQLVSGGSGNPSLLISDCETMKMVCILSGHTKQVLSVARGGRGSTIASGGEDKMAKLWDWSAEQCVHTLQLSDVATSLSPHDHHLAVALMDGSCAVYDVRNWQQVSSFQPHSNECRSVRHSPCGKWLLTGSYDGSVCLGEATGVGWVEMAQHGDKVIQARWHPVDGQVFASTSTDKTACFWTMQS